VNTNRLEVAKKARGQDRRALYAPIDPELDEKWPKTPGLGRTQRLPIAFASEWSMEP